MQRDSLRFVEDNHRTSQVVQLAAARRAIGKQAFKELDICGYNDGGCPIFHGATEFFTSLPLYEFGFVNCRMVFENHFVAKYFAEDGCGLVNYRIKGNRIYDALKPMCFGMVKGEGEGGQGFAAASRYVERE